MCLLRHRGTHFFTMHWHCWNRKIVFLVLVCFTVSRIACGQQYSRVCYFTSWSQYRPGIGKFTVSNVDPFLCTHIIYSFYLFRWNTWLLYPDDAGAPTMLNQLVALKTRNKDLKIMIAIGGYTFGSPIFSIMSQTTEGRRTFINSVLDVLGQYNLDGVDLDWEYPGRRGGAPQDMGNFILLCQELQAAFRASGSSYLLSAAVPAGYQNIYAGFRRGSSDYLDFVNVMGYDYNGQWQATTGYNAPLYAIPTDVDRRFNLNETLRIYTEELLFPKTKIMVGMPTYGHTWTLTNPSQTGPGSPGSPGPPTPFYRSAGVITYYEVCMNESQMERRFDNTALVPYGIRNGVWISYDDVESLRYKTQLVIDRDYAGVMFWALDLDDFRGVCGGKDFSLITSVKELLDAASGTLVSATPPRETPTAPSTTQPIPTADTRETTPRPTSTVPTMPTSTPPTTPIPTTPPSDISDFCRWATEPLYRGEDGYYADPNDCSKFYYCLQSGYCYQGLYCPPGTLWDIRLTICNHAYLVQCVC